MLQLAKTMESHIKISVIVPVYNTEKYLRRCLESIINQSLREIEIIVVNDGSPDNSAQVIADLAQTDNRIITVNQPNGGVSKARNNGLNIAKGEYVLLLDSDDWIENNYLADMYSFAKSEDLDIVVSDMLIDHDNGKVDYVKDLRFTHGPIVSPQEYLQEFTKGNVSPAIWNKLFRTQLYHTHGITYPEGITLGQDLATTPRLAYYAKRIGKLNQAYVHYIQNPHGATKEKNIEKMPKLLAAFTVLENFFKEQALDYDAKALKIHNLAYYLFNNRYDISNAIYRDTITTYLDLHKGPIPKNLNKKLLPYFLLLKIAPTQSTFKILHMLHNTSKKLIAKLKGMP